MPDTGNDATDATRSDVPSDVLSHVISLYPVGGLRAAERATEGMMNENWIIDAETGRYFLRRRDPFFDERSIDFELNLIDGLARSGFPTPGLVRSLEGRLKVSEGGSYWELYEFIPGERFDTSNIDQIRSAARLLARFHTECSAFSAGAESIPYRTMDFDNICGLIREFEGRFSSEIQSRTGVLGILAAPVLGRFFEGQAVKVMEGIKPLASCRPVLIHGDLQPSNIIFRGDEAASLIDFGNAALSYRAYDVAKGMLRFGILSPGYRSQTDIAPSIDTVRAKAFLEAYQKELPLSDAGLLALPAIIRGIYLFGLGFYMLRDTGFTSRIRLILYALRFIRWLDRHPGLDDIIGRSV